MSKASPEDCLSLTNSGASAKLLERHEAGRSRTLKQDRAADLG